MDATLKFVMKMLLCLFLRKEILIIKKKGTVYIYNVVYLCQH